MRTCVWLLAVACLFVGTVRAEDKPNPDELKKAYDAALVNLKLAQNAKMDLAKQNEKLAKEVESLKKKLDVSQGQIEQLKRQVADNDQKTFDLRSARAAWQSFMRVHPSVLAEWKAFLADDVLALPQETQPLIEPDLMPPLAQMPGDHQ